MYSEAAYHRACDALGDGTRRAILDMIRARPCSVGEIASRLPVSQPAVSQHLRKLREADLVRAVPVGRSRIYHLRPEGLAGLRDHLDSFWEQALEALRVSLEEHGEVTDDA